MSLFKSSPEVQKMKSDLRTYLEQAPDGSRHSWLEIEIATGVRMDRRGQVLVKTVLRQGKRPWQSIHGYGIELSSENNALDILGNKLRRIDSALHVAHVTSGNLVVRHANAMLPSKRNELLRQQSLLSTLQLVTEQGAKAPALPEHKT